MLKIIAKINYAYQSVAWVNAGRERGLGLGTGTGTGTQATMGMSRMLLYTRGIDTHTHTHANTAGLYQGFYRVLAVATTCQHADAQWHRAG